jgi:hypothetical protein
MSDGIRTIPLNCQVAEELSRRLAGIFMKDRAGARPVNALYPRFQQDPNFRDYIPFHEYFDGESGRGRGVAPDGLDSDHRQAPPATLRIFLSEGKMPSRR